MSPRSNFLMPNNNRKNKISDILSQYYSVIFTLGHNAEVPFFFIKVFHVPDRQF